MIFRENTTCEEERKKGRKTAKRKKNHTSEKVNKKNIQRKYQTLRQTLKGRQTKKKLLKKNFTWKLGGVVMEER